MSQSNIEVYLEIKADNLSVSSKFTGDAKSVAFEVEKFLFAHLPQLQVIGKLFITLPTSQEIIDFLSNDIRISGSEIIFLHKPKDTIEGIKKALLAARLSYELGLRSSPNLSIRELSMIISASQKTIGNNLSLLVKSGEVERIDKGTYKLSDRGVFSSIPLESLKNPGRSGLQE
ncbi:MAG: hypothetical protein QXS21_03805 [Thermoproteota archaeon]|nr:hypothetical protein [Candidatus Brockarchaeota archaeon]MBO3762838.1 hypothetical protein [Candidatus Brockarchaeota archaeon]MBO3768399.1 hypothetical protein [Candidatus Brockarchaeota archaeon]MBO3801516.1 hypothetical protein [Candidatus Brockarchaeota archaeon]